MPPRKHSLRPLSLAEEGAYFAMEIQIGADGSLVNNDEVVFLLDYERFGLLRVDYFHGCNAWGVVGQAGWRGTCWLSWDRLGQAVISITGGCAVNAIRKIQQRWRMRKWNRMVDTVLAIARRCVRSSRKGKFVQCCLTRIPGAE